MRHLFWCLWHSFWHRWHFSFWLRWTFFLSFPRRGLRWRMRFCRSTQVPLVTWRPAHPAIRPHKMSVPNVASVVIISSAINACTSIWHWGGMLLGWHAAAARTRAHHCTIIFTLSYSTIVRHNDELESKWLWYIQTDRQRDKQKQRQRQTQRRRQRQRQTYTHIHTYTHKQAETQRQEVWTSCTAELEVCVDAKMDVCT